MPDRSLVAIIWIPWIFLRLIINFVRKPTDGELFSWFSDFVFWGISFIILGMLFTFSTLKDPFLFTIGSLIIIAILSNLWYYLLNALIKKIGDEDNIYLLDIINKKIREIWRIHKKN